MGPERAPVIHVFFGGSFDPPHIGHEKMLLTLLQDSLVSHVHLVPTKNNPLKNASPLFELSKQKKIMQLWKEHLEKTLTPASYKKFHLEFLELENEHSSFTFNSLNHFRNRDGGEWVLSLGADLLGQLSNWYQIENLLKSLHSVWVFPRPQHSLDLETQVPKNLLALTQWRLMPTHISDVSSTQLRQQNSLHDSIELGLASFLNETNYD